VGELFDVHVLEGTVRFTANISNKGRSDDYAVGDVVELGIQSGA
jgi:hypothetical protein